MDCHWLYLATVFVLGGCQSAWAIFCGVKTCSFFKNLRGRLRFWMLLRIKPEVGLMLLLLIKFDVEGVIAKLLHCFVVYNFHVFSSCLDPWWTILKFFKIDDSHLVYVYECLIIGYNLCRYLLLWTFASCVLKYTYVSSWILALNFIQFLLIEICKVANRTEYWTSGAGLLIHGHCLSFLSS